MRRHVLGVGRRRRDFRVATRGVEPEGSELRRVVGVNEVVGESRMLGKTTEERIQDRRGLFLPDECRIGRGRRSDEGQGVVDRHLGVVGDITGETRQRIRVRLEPLGVRNGFVIAVERADSGDESPLPHGRCRDRLRAYGRGGTLTQMVARRTADEGIAPCVQGQAPIGHGARGIRHRHGLECAGALFPPEGMQQRHRALEARLRFGIAGDGEHDVPEGLLLVIVVVLSGEPTGAGGADERGHQEKTGRVRHGRLRPGSY